MNTIPVGETIRRGYGFAAGNFATLFGIVWLPMALTIGCGILFSHISPAFAAALIGSDTEAFKSAWPLILIFDLLAFLLMSMMIVGITEYALEDIKKRRLLYFSLDGRVWRLFKAYLLSALMMFAVAAVVLVGLILIAIIVAKVSGLSPDELKNATRAPMVGLAVLLVPLLLLCGLFYFVIRQMTLLSPVVVAEADGGMRRAWVLSRGHFWRLLAIFMATLIPTVVVWIIIQYGFIFDGLPPNAASGATPEDLAQWGANGLARMKQYAFVIVPGFLLMTAFSYGAIYGALAYAYRILAPVGGDTPEI